MQYNQLFNLFIFYVFYHVYILMYSASEWIYPDLWRYINVLLPLLLLLLLLIIIIIIVTKL